jgi:hypothetical protein
VVKTAIRGDMLLTRRSDDNNWAHARRRTVNIGESTHNAALCSAMAT